MRTSELVETYARVLFDLASLSDAADAADEGVRLVWDTWSVAHS